MSDETPPRPAPEGYASWPAYWQAQGMPWRTEPEVDAQRQQFLSERLAVEPDISKGIYPFRDENGSIKLSRADVEWLLATHESGGMRGPVDWRDAKQQKRDGLDLRGADLRHASLARLPLARMHGGLRHDEHRDIPSQQREWAAIHADEADLSFASLMQACLYRAHLTGSNLYRAHCEHADLSRTHLEKANLFEAHLEGADLRYAYFDAASFLRNPVLSSKEAGAVRLSGVHWGGADLTGVDWSHLEVLGDEQLARRQTGPNGVKLDSASQLHEYTRATRANRQLATALRDQGMNEEADHFAYRAQVLQRRVFGQQGKRGRQLLSWFLDLIAGYGYQPQRSLLAYLLAIFGFGMAYYALGQAVGPHLSPLGAFVFSMTSFHGRGFFPGGIQLDDPITVLAAFEAFVGLVIEVSFIATFTQRFFAR